MNYLKAIICLFRTRIVYPYLVSGHDFFEIPDKTEYGGSVTATPVGAGRLKCQVCGKEIL